MAKVLFHKEDIYKISLERATKRVRDIQYDCINGNKEHQGISRWILIRGYWEDEGIWIDAEYWKDN